MFEAGASPAKEEDTSDEDSVDTLPPLEGAANEMRLLLDGMGLNPLVHMLRHNVVHEFCDHVSERAKRKRKNTLRYTVGDTARRCRKTDPPVTSKHVRAVINALAQAGTLLHADGNPVRSQSAPFEVNQEPEELLDRLLEFYLQTLAATGLSLNNPGALSQLLYADDDRWKLAERIKRYPPQKQQKPKPKHRPTRHRTPRFDAEVASRPLVRAQPAK